jgi:uncharacterized protein YggE
MPYQNLPKYGLPALAVVIVFLVAAWMFNLPPVSALTDRTQDPVDSQSPAGDQLTSDSFDVVQVSGRGTATGTPDLAELSLSVSVNADTVVEARNAAAETMTDVRTALADNDIADTDVATRHFRIHPNYEYGPDGRDQKGYTVSNGLNVKVRDTSEVGTIIDAAVTAGGDHIVFDNLAFQISDTADLEREARESAVKDMQSRAEQIAEFSDRELGDLKIVSETPIGNIAGGIFERALAAPAAVFDTPISTGEDTITVVVYGVYELLD